MRGQYIPFENDPLRYAMGPGHLFFGQGVGTPAPNSPPGTSPLENPSTPNAPGAGSPLESRIDPGTAEEFNNPNISYNPVWGNLGMGLAGMIGGPALSGLVGAGLGANMTQAVNQEYGSRGLAPSGNIPGSPLGGAAIGAARGALGTLGGLAGLTPGWSDLTAAAQAIPGIQGANDWGGVMQAIAENQRGVLSGYTVAGLPPEELGGMTQGKDLGGDPQGSSFDPGVGSDKGDAPSDGDIGDASTDSKKAGGLINLPERYAVGGVIGLPGGGKVAAGPGGGLDDLIPTTIDGRRAARLSDGEFVIPADVVSMFGDGSTRAGSQRLYDLIKTVRREKTGNTRQAGPLRVGGILERVLS
jgi:hypothetical protein